jgi:RNA-directed DNA polymerase
VKTFLEKVRKIVKGNKQATAGNLIWQLNPVIRGWAMYHRHQASKETFNKVDHAIFQLLWYWAKRRHPNKSKRWIKEKYFRTIGTRRWVFAGEVEGKRGEILDLQLYRAAMVHIQRHKLIKGEANPYDPQWEEYFDQRLGIKWLQGTNRKKLIALWKNQAGKCPLCDQKITKETGWNIHHIVYRVYGGTDNLTNLLLLHPNCHRQVHSQDSKVTEPGVEKCLEKA